MRTNDENKENDPQQTDADLPLHFRHPKTNRYSSNIGLVTASTCGAYAGKIIELSISASIILPLPQITEKLSRSQNRAQKIDILSTALSNNQLEEAQRSKKAKLNKEM